MTDLRLALQAAAPAPARALDMAAVHRRARRAGVRRVVAWIASASAVIVAGAGVGNGVLVNAGRGGGNGGGRDAAGQHTPVVGFEEAGTDTAPGGSPSGRRPASSPRTAATLARHGSAAPARKSDYPAQSNCTVDTAGLAVGEVRVCRFTATDTGYASIDSSSPAETNGSVEQFAHGDVYVTHNGVRKLAWSSDQCGTEVHVGALKTFYSGCKGPIMAAGDYVEVELTKKGDDGFVVTLYAGKDAPA